MEENKFDPLQFIGFLLISAILMFWFYDNQSNYIENQQEVVIENPIEKFDDNSNAVNVSEQNSNRVELDEKFTEEIITLENCLLYTSPSPRDATLSRMPSSA